MSADLDFMINASGQEVARMAHIEAITPWHGLGQTIPAGATVDAMAKMIGADIDPIKVPLFAALPDGSTIRIATHAAIIQPPTNKLLSVMGSDYKIHSPRQIIEFFAESYSAGNMEIETLGFLDGGRKMWALGRGIRDRAEVKGEQVRLRVLGVTSFDGSTPTQYRPCQELVVCRNTWTLALAEKQSTVSVRHSTLLDGPTLDKVKTFFSSIGDQYDRMLSIGDTLADTEVTDAETYLTLQWLTDRKWITKRQQETGSASLAALLASTDNRQVVRELIRHASETANRIDAPVYLDSSDVVTSSDLSRVGTSILDAIISGPGSELPARRGTAWGLLQGVTNHVDHKAGRDHDTALNSAWFGANATLKTSALDLLVNMAELKGNA